MRLRIPACVNAIDALGVKIRINDLQPSRERQLFQNLPIGPAGDACDMIGIACDPGGRCSFFRLAGDGSEGFAAAVNDAS